MIQAINKCITELNHIGEGLWSHAAGIFIQVSVLIVLLLIIDYMLRKRVRAVFRYGLWMLLFVKLVLPASFTLPTGIGYWLGDYFPRDVATVTSEPRSVVVAPPFIDMPTWYIPLEASPRIETAAAGAALESISWQGLMFAGWLIGMLVLSVFLVQRACFVRGLIRQSRPANARLRETLKECRGLMGMTQDIELRLTDQRLSPAVCGLRKPIILLPALLLERLSREKLKAVLVHELAHIKRADVWVNLLQIIMQIVYFYNPLVWLANVMVRRAREQAVDEMVLVTLKPETRNYSNTLIDIAEMSFWKPNFSLRLIGVVESKKALERRITHMLNRPVPKNAKLGILGLCIIIGVGAVALPMGCQSSGAGDLEQPSSMENIIVPGERVGDYTFAMSKDEILERLGKPRAIFYGDKKYTLDTLPQTYFMSYSDVSFHIYDDAVKGITALHYFYKFANGLGVGDSETKIKQAFGDDYEIKEAEKKDFLTYEDKGLMFEINKRDRTVMEINVFRTGPGTRHQKADIPSTSTINEEGRIVDKLDYPFVNDPRLTGTWKSVDFVGEIKEFKAGRKQWGGGDLYLKELIFLPNGRTFRPWWTWTKGLVFHSGDKTAARYTLKDIDGSTYMFFEWKSGDYTIRHRKPAYYVLKKTSSETGGLAEAWASQPSDAEFAGLLPARIEKLEIDTAGLAEVKKIFGNPAQYIWGRETFTEEALPRHYILVYPSRFHIFMRENQIVELRHGSGSTYVYRDKLRSGSTLEDVFEVVGHPKKVIEGEKNTFEDGVLYKDIEGQKGYCYYARSDHKVRLWFQDYKISAIYMTCSDYYTWVAPPRKGLLGLELNDKRWPLVDVVPGLPAANAGVQNGDKILTVNDKDIAHITTIRDALTVLHGDPGEKVKLTVQRGEQILTFEFERSGT